MTELNGRAATDVVDAPVRQVASSPASEHELSLARAFVDLAGGLVGDFDIQDLLHRLAEHCVTLVDAAAGGIVLVDPDKALRVVTAHPESAAVLELIQVQADEGPCVDSVHTGRPVRCDDLDTDTARWPTWAPLALGAGIRTVYATPLRARGEVIGSLNLFGTGDHPMTERDLLIIGALTDVATLTIQQQRRADAAGVLNKQLETALASRIRIEQAKGAVSNALGVSVDDAFELLRHNARSTNTSLTVLAGALNDGRITAADLLPPPPRRH